MIQVLEETCFHGANGPKFSWLNMVSRGSLEKIMLWLLEANHIFRWNFGPNLSISHKITLYSNSPSFIIGELVSTYFSSLDNFVKESGSKLHKDCKALILKSICTINKIDQILFQWSTCLAIKCPTQYYIAP
jgi:hypothetical protein